jgi:superfamily II DNA/RNA helicase
VVEVEPDQEDQIRAIEHEKEVVQRHEEAIEDARAEWLAAQLDDDEERYRKAVERLREVCRVAFTEMAAVAHEVARAKVPHVVEFVGSLLEQAPKVVLFAHHNDVIQQYVEALGTMGYEVLSITGATPPDQRVEIVRRFNDDPEVRVLVLSIRAAGVGLSVKAAVEVFGELDWTPGVMTQAEDRCHGVGRGVEGEPLMIYHVVMDGSIDARRAKVLVEKQDIADRALDRERPEPEQHEEDPALLVGEQSESEKAVRHTVKAKDVPAVPQEIKALVHRSLQVLAAFDRDGARVINGVGFNKVDSGFGRRLAMLPTLSDRQAYAAALMLRKYAKQLGQDGDTIRQWVAGVVRPVAA